MKYVVAPDTNILCHYGKIENFVWRSLFPDATEIIIVVCPTVTMEMDKHKTSKDRTLQKRARDFSRMLAGSESSNYESLVSVGDLRVEIKFAKPIHSAKLDANSFDLSVADDKIVAEIAYISELESVDITVLTNDARPTWLARGVGINSVRPPAEWERQDEITEVKDQIGSASLGVEILETSWNHPIAFSEDFCANFAHGMWQVDFNERMRIELERAGMNDQDLLRRSETTLKQERALDRFKDEFTSEDLLRTFQLALSRKNIVINLWNRGTAYADDIELNLEILKNGAFTLDGQEMIESHWCGLSSLGDHREINYPLLGNAPAYVELSNEMNVSGYTTTTMRLNKDTLPYSSKASAEFQLFPLEVDQEVKVSATIFSRSMKKPIRTVFTFSPNETTIGLEDFGYHLNSMHGRLPHRLLQLTSLFGQTREN